jgi:hypothetical protein
MLMRRAGLWCANVRHADKRAGFAVLPSGSEYRIPDSGRRSTLNTKAAQVELFLTDAVHQLKASYRDRRVAELLEPHHHSNALLDAAVVLLNQVIEIFRRPQLGLRRQRTIGVQLARPHPHSATGIYN